MTILQRANRIKADLLMVDENIAVLTEDFEDNFFWKDVFETATPDLKPKFPNASPKGTAGKSIIMKYREFVDKRLVLAFDSDNEYIFENKSNPSKPFLYQTYCYSIENFSFHSEGINSLIWDITQVKYDFKSFQNIYSQSIAQLFYWWIYAKRTWNEEILQHCSEENFKRLLQLDIQGFNELGDTKYLIKKLKIKIIEFFALIEKEMETDWFSSIKKDEIPVLARELEQHFQIKTNNVYLFFKGHIIYDDVFKPFLKKVILLLKEQKIEEIKENFAAAKKNVLADRIKHYEKISSKDFNTKLSENYRYCLKGNCLFFNKIVEDIQRDFTV